ncbi:MAG TPA: hypothetical protein VKP30_18255 [Polyangiaceae bacterium]|nr:hypothetical protein [Polyangiaceae bacterium]
MESAFSFRVVGAQSWDVNDDNVDVEVTLHDGRRYGATFFTLSNIAHLFEKNRHTGECGGGTYLWARGMVILKDLSPDTMHATVKDLMQVDELECAFEPLDPLR